MERTFRLREESFTFDKKGMILKGEIVKDGQNIDYTHFGIMTD